MSSSVPNVTMDDIAAILKGVKWYKNGPAAPGLVQQLVGNAVAGLPEDYLDFLLYSNGGEGKLGIEPGYFQLWPSEDVIDLNKGYEIDKYLPGFFGFGSNGGDELLAFDINHGKPWKIVMIPFIPMDAQEAIIVANNFLEFIRAIGRDLK